MSALSILVVDDNERFRTVLGLVLEANLFRVTLAASHQEALARLKAEFFSLVLTDYLLDARGEPDRIAGSLLTAAHPVPVGCLTGYSHIPGNIDRQYAFVLHKPVTAEHILAAIGSLFSPKRYDRARRTVVDSYFAGLSAANWDLVASLCSEEITFNPPLDAPQRAPIQGKRSFRKYTEETLRVFPNARFEVQGISYLPNGVVARYLARWESVSGERLQHQGEVLFQFAGDRIAEIGVRLDLAILKTMMGTECEH